jgi:hypothetical protein
LHLLTLSLTWRDNINVWQLGFNFRSPISREATSEHDWFVILLQSPLSRRLTTYVGYGFWFPLNLHFIEYFQLLLHHILWSSLNHHREHFPLAEDINVQLLANLGNVLGTIDPRLGLQSLWSSLNHQIGLWSSLNHHHHSVCGNPKTTIIIQFVVIPKPPYSDSTFSHQQLHIYKFHLPTFKYHLSPWTHIHPFRLRGGMLET